MDEPLEIVLRKLNVGIRTEDPVAFTDIARLAEQYPEEPKVWRMLAYAHEARDDHAAAIAAVTLALALRPRDPALFSYRGQCALKAGDFDLAVADFGQGLVLCDELSLSYLRDELYFLRAEAFVQLGKKVEALADLSHVEDDYVFWTTELRSKADLLVLCGASVPPPKEEEAPASSEPLSYSGNLVFENRSVLPESPDELEVALAKELGEAGIAAVDAALLKYMRARRQKGARVIVDALESGGHSPRDETRIRLYARRLIALAEVGAIEAVGNLHRPRFSEVALPERP